MKRLNSVKIILIMIAALYSGNNAYADTEVVQALRSLVQPTVTISKSALCVEAASANPQTGALSNTLRSVFTLQTNGTDDDYDFIMTSSLIGDGGEPVSAYSNSGNILFGHTTNPPTSTAISNAKSGGTNNKNVIVYPVTATVKSPMTIEYRTNYSTYGDCYVVKVNGSTDSTNISHSLSTLPVSGSYNIGQDESGSYQATVTFTAISK